MVSRRILKHFNCTSERLREVFTCEDVDSPHYKTREKFEEEIARHVHEGVDWSCKNSRLYHSVDLAWDSAPITKGTIPLLLYAQDKLDMASCSEQLEDLGCAADFCEYDESGEVKNISLPRLYEVSVNLIRSYITRRVAAQVSRFSNLWPYFKYDPRGTTTVDKLRADVLSQRVEIMTDQYGYRHFFSQCTRDMFLYGYSLCFPTSAWDRQIEHYDKKDIFGSEKMNVQTRVSREGVEFVSPHPTRTFYDISSPLSQVNTDTGPDWLGFWDVVRYRDIDDDSAYWNREAIKYSDSLIKHFSSYKALFSYYYSHINIDFPSAKVEQGSEFPLLNDRTANVGTSPGAYTKDQKDDAVFLTQYFRKVNPKRDGLGDYPGDVWVRLVVASDDTVVFGEYLPSLPAIYGGINQKDDRLVNVSMAHELMPFQDQMTNILSQMLLTMKAGLTQLWMVNQDVLSEEMREYMKESLKGRNYYEEPKAIMYSARKAADLGLDVKNVVHVVQLNMSEKVNESLKALVNLLQIVERLLILSPTELGQPLKSDSTATEVQEIANTTNTIYQFISEGIDELRGGAKKMLYESLVGFSTEKIKVPVLKRYTKKTLEDAGFEEAAGSQTGDAPDHRTVIGSVEALVHDYVFSSRDGAERSSNTQVAQTLTALLGQLLQVPELAQAVGKERLFAMINEIFRNSGTGFDVLLSVEDGEDQQLPAEQNKARIDKLEQFLMKLVQDLQKAGAIPETPQQAADSGTVQPTQQPQQQPQQKPI